MKVKFLWATLFLALSFYSCDDNTKGLGLDMLPDRDQVTITHKVYETTSQSIPVDSVYAKTDIVYIGKYLDETFGSYEASFLTEFNCVDSLAFPKLYQENPLDGEDNGIMAGDSTVSTEIILYYTELLGDTVSPSNISLYKLNKKLKTNHYTNIKAEQFYQEQDLLAEASYSGITLKENNTNTNVRKIQFKLDKEIGEDILRLNREFPEYFYNNKKFREKVFKGIYAKCTQGEGSILFVSDVYLNVLFNTHHVDSLGHKLLKTDGTDSLQLSRISFSATREIVQANRLTSDSEVLNERIQEKNHTYIKAPAGIFTEITLPLEDLMKDDEVANDTINSVRLVLQSFLNKENNSSFKIKRPTYLGLFKKSQYKSFFEENKIFDNISSFYAGLNTNGQYAFNQLERLIVSFKSEKKKAMDQAKADSGDDWNAEEWEQEWLENNEDWGKVVLVPVNLDRTTDQKNTIRGVSHNLRPEAVRLEGGTILKNGKKPLEMKVLFTSINENSNL